MYNEVKDSGERQQFETGAVRDTQKGKGRYDLIPRHALRRLAQHFENGAVKYGDNNWKKGMPLDRYYDSAMRHLINWRDGMKDEDHLAAVLFNVMAILETEYMIDQKVLPDTLLPADMIQFKSTDEIDVSKLKNINSVTFNTPAAKLKTNDAKLFLNGVQIDDTWDYPVYNNTAPVYLTSGQTNTQRSYVTYIVDRDMHNITVDHSCELRGFSFNDGNSHYTVPGLLLSDGDTIIFNKRTNKALDYTVKHANGELDDYTAKKVF